MNRHNSSLMTLPSPCGLALSSVTSDNEFIYALQPDRRTVYKMDACGEILCVFKLQRKYTAIHYCVYGNGRFFATADGERFRIYILSKCFREIGYIEPDISDSGMNSGCGCGCGGGGRSVAGDGAGSGCGCGGNLGLRTTLFIGPAGDCSGRDNDCVLAVANLSASFAVSPSGRVLSRLGSAGRNQYYTAIAENGGILYEGLESRLSPQTFVRATLLSTGQTKVQRLPFGYRVRSFFCYGGRLYAFITKNSYHAYIAAVCTFVSGDVLGGEIIGLPESPYDNNCCEESCNFGKHSVCVCGSGCGGVSTNQTEMCDNAVSGDTTESCDVDELCRLYNCLKILCKDKKHDGCSCGGGCSCGCGGNHGGCGCGHHDKGGVMGEYETSYDGGCCENGTLSCNCYRKCRCTENDVDSENCLPLPPCPPGICCNPCNPGSQNVRCSDNNLKVTFSAAYNN